eukprot:g3760.t1
MAEKISERLKAQAGELHMQGRVSEEEFKKLMHVAGKIEDAEARSSSLKDFVRSLTVPQRVQFLALHKQRQQQQHRQEAVQMMRENRCSKTSYEKKMPNDNVRARTSRTLPPRTSDKATLDTVIQNRSISRRVRERREKANLDLREAYSDCGIKIGLSVKKASRKIPKQKKLFLPKRLDSYSRAVRAMSVYKKYEKAPSKKKRMKKKKSRSAVLLPSTKNLVCTLNDTQQQMRSQLRLEAELDKTDDTSKISRMINETDRLQKILEDVRIKAEKKLRKAIADQKRLMQHEEIKEEERIKIISSCLVGQEKNVERFQEMLKSEIAESSHSKMNIIPVSVSPIRTKKD